MPPVDTDEHHRPVRVGKVLNDRLPYDHDILHRLQDAQKDENDDEPCEAIPVDEEGREDQYWYSSSATRPSLGGAVVVLDMVDGSGASCDNPPSQNYTDGDRLALEGEVEFLRKTTLQSRTRAGA
ncbi:9072_t:CDS:2, partial [Acaulospora colombiana]